MPRSRLMLKVPAARAAPVPPAQTSACALPSATALVASTIDASRVVRAAATGSAASTPAGGSPSSAAGPNRSTRAPWAAAIAAPAATSDGPRSAPLQSTATTGSEASRPSPLLVLVLVLVVVARHDDFTTGVVAADRAHPVRATRAVALRAGVQAGRSDAVLGAALGRAAVGLLFLGDGHRGPEG